jgi:predicted ATP-grasp superfamily ATP-dependent carboligase
LLKYRDVLKEYFIFPIADLNVVDKLLDKHNFYQLLEQHDIPHAKTYFPNNIDELKKISEKILLPCIIKPAYSGYFRRDFEIKFFVARTKDEIIRYHNIIAKRNHKLVIQEIIPGEANHMYGFNTYYDQDYKPHGIFMYNRIREWPIFAGNGCFLQSVEVPELEKITTSFIRKINYYGIVDAEFKKDPRDGLFKLIEINPRIWLQNSFPTRYNINIPHIAYMDSIGKDLEINEQSKVGVKWLDLCEDIPSAIKNLKRGTLSLREWITSYNGEKVHAIFDRNDPLPAFIKFVNYILIEIPYYLSRHLNGYFGGK